jgi:hypothetical protein
MAVPVFVIFFALAGAELHIQQFLALWPVVLVVALIRVGGIYAAATGASRLAGAEPSVIRYGWTGLVSQAGVALGMATIVADRLPVVGVAMETLVIGVVAFNESLGPILFRWGLLRAGEVRVS